MNRSAVFLIVCSSLFGFVSACQLAPECNTSECTSGDTEGGPSTGTPVDATFTELNERVFIPKCQGCHQSGSLNQSEGEYVWDLSEDLYSQIVDGEFLAADSGVSGNDKYVRQVVEQSSISGNMPPAGNLQLTAEEKAALREWIDDGAPNN